MVFRLREKMVVCLPTSPTTMRSEWMIVVVLVEVHHELGDVGQDVHLAHVVGHPAPFFHVGAQLVGKRFVARRQIGLAQLLKLRLLRVEPAQVGIGRIGGSDFLDDALRVDELRLAVELGGQQDRRIDDASAARKAGVLQDGERDRHVVVRDLGWAQVRDRPIGDVGEGKVAGLEPPVAGFHDLGDDGPAFVGETFLRHPNRSVSALGVELRQHRALFQLLRGALGGECIELGAQRSCSGAGRCGSLARGRSGGRGRRRCRARSWRRLGDARRFGRNRLGLRPRQWVGKRDACNGRAREYAQGEAVAANHPVPRRANGS